MEQFIIDEETGESLGHPFFDEVTARSVDPVNNVETGEPELSIVEPTMTRSRRVPFQIPKEVKESLSSKSAASKESRDFMELEPVPVGTAFGQINPICLILAAIVYFRLFLVLLMLFEVILHVWAHHKNKALQNASVYFRSPFHGISSEFCALCQNETCMDRVGKIQQIRLHKFLQQCNYIKRVVT